MFSPDGARVLTASDDGTARLWGLDGKPRATLKGHTGPVNSAVFAPDGKRILTASYDHTARLWDLNGKVLAVLMGHSEEINRAVFAPDGSRIVTASEKDLMAKLRDRDGNPLANLVGHSGKVIWVEFSPDSNRVLVTFASSAAVDNSVRMWDREGKHLFTLEHPDVVIYGAFAPDGGRFLTVTYDGTVWLWDRDGQPLATLSGHTDAVHSAVFAPDGSRILTASEDHTARLWEAFPEVQIFVDRVKAEVPRCLSPEQRQRLFLSPTPPRWCIDMHKWPYDRITPAK